MPIADLAEFNQALLTGQIIPFGVTSVGINAGRPSDLFPNTQTSKGPGAAPTTAVVPTEATPGALDFENGTVGALNLIGARIGAVNPGAWLVCDRLSHQGGLVGNVATVQTTNLPTAALTRYTTGEGVLCGLTMYTAIGNTASTVTISYTNQAGTSGRTSVAAQIGGANQGSTARRMLWIPPQAGDTGFRAVASVTLAATTGTAGNMGVTLFKPLGCFIVGVDGMAYGNMVRGPVGSLPAEIVDNACLFLVPIPMGITDNNGGSNGTLITAEY